MYLHKAIIINISLEANKKHCNNTISHDTRDIQAINNFMIVFPSHCISDSYVMSSYTMRRWGYQLSNKCALLQAFLAVQQAEKPSHCVKFNPSIPNIYPFPAPSLDHKTTAPCFSEAVYGRQMCIHY